MDIHRIENTVVIIGRTTGSCTDKPVEEEIRDTWIYKVIVEDHMNGSINVRNTKDGAEFKIITPITNQ